MSGNTVWAAVRTLVRRREVPRPELRCPRCRAEIEPFWYHCPNCAKALRWGDTQLQTGAECRYCRWMVSDSFSFCPWCGRNISDEQSSLEPLKKPKGFKYERRCKRCHGGLQYPMQWCPWCGKAQRWKYERFEGNTGIFERLLSGDWSEPEFLVVPPGKRIRAKYDGTIVAAV